MMLEEISMEGQRKLLKAKVLIVGLGGLGSPIALYLAAAGVGHMGLVDADVVSLSNLQRQVLYTAAEVGQHKTLAAAARLRSLNPQIVIEPMVCRLDATNAEHLISQFDVVVDACDNFETRYLMDKVCESLDKPLVYGAIQGFQGQVSVFTSSGRFRYRDLYPEPSIDVSKAVIGMTAAVVGSVQAHEVIKHICGYGDLLTGRLWMIDLRTMQTHLIDL